MLSPTNRRRAPWMLCLGLFTLFVIAAADRPAPRVGIIDADKIRTDSAYIRARLTEISKPAEALKSQLIAKRAAIQTAVDEYQAQSAALSEETRKAKMMEINKLRAEGEKLSTEFTDMLNKTEGSDLAFIKSQVMEIVSAIATERGMDVVLSTNNVLFNAAGTDLTALVIQRLDATKPAAK